MVQHSKISAEESQDFLIVGIPQPGFGMWLGGGLRPHWVFQGHTVWQSLPHLPQIKNHCERRRMCIQWRVCDQVVQAVSWTHCYNGGNGIFLAMKVSLELQHHNSDILFSSDIYDNYIFFSVFTLVRCQDGLVRLALWLPLNNMMFPPSSNRDARSSFEVNWSRNSTSRPVKRKCKKGFSLHVCDTIFEGVMFFFNLHYFSF